MRDACEGGGGGGGGGVGYDVYDTKICVLVVDVNDYEMMVLLTNFLSKEIRTCLLVWSSDGSNLAVEPFCNCNAFALISCTPAPGM